MFKTPAQRAAFFSALKKKKAGLDNPSAAEPMKPMKVQPIGMPSQPGIPQNPAQNALNQVQGQVPKFARLKKIMKP